MTLGASSRELRLAVFSPVPPAPSGIADYLLDLLPLLPAAWRIDLFVDPGVEPDVAALEATRADKGGLRCFPEDAFADRHAAAPYDLNVYQLGNDAGRVPSFRLALARPGLLILHDAVLHPARAHYAIERGQIADYRRQAQVCREDVGSVLGHLVAGGLAGPELFFRFPMCEDLVRASLATGIHGELACGWLRALVPGARVVPLVHWRSLPEADEAERSGWRRRLIAGPSSPTADGNVGEERIGDVDRAAIGAGTAGAGATILIGSFGNVGAERRLERVLEALAAVGQAPPWWLVVVGAVDPSLGLEQQARRLRIAHRVRWLGRVRGDDFAALARTVDLAVNLRYPTARSSSGVLHQLLGAGVPTLISDLIDWRDYPEPAVARIPPGPDGVEREALVAALQRWICDPGARRAAASKARQWAAAALTPERMASSYVAAVEASLLSSAGV